MSEYNDIYSTCESTYATLLIYPGGVPLFEVTRRLKVNPTRTQTAEARAPGTVNLPAVWSLCSDEKVQSRDVRRHIDWIPGQVSGKTDVFHWLRKKGASTEVSCYWLTARGHGGPSLWSSQMAILGSLGLDIWFDFYAV